MGRRSREKGAQAERAAAAILRLIHPDAARRVSGEEGQGENLGRDLKGTPGLCVQVKETGAPQPLLALEEAIAAASGFDEIPVAIVRQARMGSSGPFRVVLTLRDWLLLEQIRVEFRRVMAHSYSHGRLELDAKLDRMADADASAKARIG